MNGPFWTAYEPLDKGTSNEDPLGFYAYAMRLAEEWLPGITTRTRRIRYYSMVCGGLMLIEEKLGDIVRSAADHDAERAKLFMRWERLWVAWNVAVAAGAGRGLIGRTKTERFFSGERFTARSLDYDFIARQPDLGALGSYRTSLEAFGLLRAGASELTPAGKRLGDLFWQQDRGGRCWDAAARSVATGRLCFPRTSGRLAALGSRFGLAVRANGELRAEPLKEELGLLRERLLPATGGYVRRTEVLEYLRKRRLSGMDEFEILSIASRGAYRVDGGTPLERRAAAIVALEAYKASLIKILNVYRDRLLVSAAPSVPSALSADRRLHELTRSARSLRTRLSRFLNSAQFSECFRDFQLGRDLDMSRPVPLVQGLLEAHRTEMARRQTPRWFHPLADGRWELDSSVAYPSSSDDSTTPYSYRTGNLLTMAREVGRRA